MNKTLLGSLFLAVILIPTAAFAAHTASKNAHAASKNPVTSNAVASNDTYEQDLASLDHASRVAQRALNPFGDAWSRRVTSNPSIPLAGTVGCYRRLAPGLTSSLTSGELSFFGALGAPFYFEECATVYEDNPVYDPVLQARVAALKLADPSVKYMGYSTLFQFVTGAAGYNELYNQHPDWFVYKKDQPHTLDNIVRTGNGTGTLLIDITNPDYQDFIAAKVASSLNTYQMDGLLADGVSTWPSDVIASTVPDATVANWPTGWVQLLGKIKTAIGPNKLVITNTNVSQSDFITNLLTVTDGVMLEDPLNATTASLTTSGYLANYQKILGIAAAKNKYVINVVNTNVNGITYTSTSRDQQHQFALTYLAEHLIFMKGKSLLMYYTPVSTSDQFGSEAYFKDWNLNVGSPLSDSYDVIAPDVYMRKFQNSFVYLNNSNTPYQIKLGSCCTLNTPAHKSVKSFTLAPKTGQILSSEAAFTN